MIHMYYVVISVINDHYNNTFNDMYNGMSLKVLLVIVAKYIVSILFSFSCP